MARSGARKRPSPAEATVITDGWQPHRAATNDLYTHERVVQPGTKASELLPVVHRIA